MKVDDDLRSLIRKKREAMGLSQSQLADLADTNQQTIDRLESGKTRFSRSVPAILKALGIKPSLAGSRNVPTLPAEPIPVSEMVGDKDLPVFGAAQGGGGTIIVSSDPVQRVRRPDQLIGVSDGYGLYVIGDSMEPAFWHGDIIEIHPHKPARPGTDVVLYGIDGGGHDVAIIKHLRKATEDEWHLTQWNPPEGEAKEFVLDRGQWPLCHVIVGRQARR